MFAPVCCCFCNPQDVVLGLLLVRWLSISAPQIPLMRFALTMLNRLGSQAFSSNHTLAVSQGLDCWNAWFVCPQWQSGFSFSSTWSRYWNSLVASRVLLQVRHQFLWSGCFSEGLVSRDTEQRAVVQRLQVRVTFIRLLSVDASALSALCRYPVPVCCLNTSLQEHESRVLLWITKAGTVKAHAYVSAVSRHP